MTVSEFYHSKYYSLITRYPFKLVEWVEYTEYEKKTDKKIGGYLKKYSFNEACQNWWDEYSDDEKAEFLEIPNFNKDKFKKITGIEM